MPGKRAALSHDRTSCFQDLLGSGGREQPADGLAQRLLPWREQGPCGLIGKDHRTGEIRGEDPLLHGIEHRILAQVKLQELLGVVPHEGGTQEPYRAVGEQKADHQHDGQHSRVNGEDLPGLAGNIGGKR